MQQLIAIAICAFLLSCGSSQSKQAPDGEDASDKGNPTQPEDSGLKADRLKPLVLGPEFPDSVGEEERDRLRAAAREKIAADLTALGKAIKAYQMNNGANVPSSLEELVILDENGYRYLAEATLPLDPYSRAYGYSVYESHPRGWELWCFGWDGVPDPEPDWTGPGADTSYSMVEAVEKND